MYPVGCNITDLGNFVVGVAVRLQMDHLALLRRQISQKRQQAVPVIHCLCQTFLPDRKENVQFNGIFLILYVCCIDFLDLCPSRLAVMMRAMVEKRYC